MKINFQVVCLLVKTEKYFYQTKINNVMYSSYFVLQNIVAMEFYIVAIEFLTQQYLCIGGLKGGDLRSLPLWNQNWPFGSQPKAKLW